MLEQHAQILHERECHDEECNVSHGVPREHNPTQRICRRSARAALAWPGASTGLHVNVFKYS
jgi:hypothetical protein